MRAKFIAAIKELLPKSPAWNITHNTFLRKLFKGIAALPEELREEIELVYLDRFPETTRCPEKWEEIFTVIFKKVELEQRRNILSLLWSMNHGGQSLFFMQKVLQSIFPEIIVAENIPCTNPRQANIAYFAVCDNEIIVCGNDKACCDYHEGDETFIPTILRNDTAGPYSIPNDADYWAFCFFVCKNIVRNPRNEILYIEKLQIPIIFKNYIEYLILRIKPVHTIAVMAVEWIEE